MRCVAAISRSLSGAAQSALEFARSSPTVSNSRYIGQSLPFCLLERQYESPKYCGVSQVSGTCSWLSAALDSPLFMQKADARERHSHQRIARGSSPSPISLLACSELASAH